MYIRVSESTCDQRSLVSKAKICDRDSKRVVYAELSNISWRETADSRTPLLYLQISHRAGEYTCVVLHIGVALLPRTASGDGHTGR
jgi:hypothetical protein